MGRPVHRAVRRRARARAARPQARRPRDGHPRPVGRGHPAAAARAGRGAPGAPLHLRPVVRARAAAELRPARRRRRRLHPRDGRLGPRAARRLHTRGRDRPEPVAPRLHPALAPRQPARDDGGPAGQREAVPAPDRGVRPGRRPAARLAAAHLRHGSEATGAVAPHPQARPLRPRGAARRRGRHARRVGQGQHLRAHLARRGLPARGPGGDGSRRPRRQLRLRLRPPRDHPARGQRPARLARVDRGHGLGLAAAGHRRRPAPRTRRGRLPDLTSVRRVRHRRALGGHLQRGAHATYRRRSAHPTRHGPGGRQAGPEGGRRGGRGHRRDAGAGTRGDPRLGRRGRHGEQRPLAGDPGARVGESRRRGADGRPRRLPQGARRRGRAGVPLPPRPGRVRLARASRPDLPPRRGPAARDDAAAVRRAVAGGRRAAAAGRAGLLGRGAVLGAAPRRRPGLAAAEPLHQPDPRRRGARCRWRSTVSRCARCR